MIEIFDGAAVNPAAYSAFILVRRTGQAEYVETIRKDSINGVSILTLNNMVGYKYPVPNRISITFEAEKDLNEFSFDLADVDNQPGWTLDQAGLIQAQEDINSWCLTGAPAGAPPPADPLLLLKKDQLFKALAAEPGWAEGDLIGLDSVGPPVWRNITTDTIIGAPNLAVYQPLGSPYPFPIQKGVDRTDAGVASTALPAAPAGTIFALLVFQKNDASPINDDPIGYYRHDGVAVTLANGMPFYNRTTLPLVGAATIANFRAISADANDHKIFIHYKGLV